MKKLLMMILAVLMFCLVLPAAAEQAEDVEVLRSALQEKYGISIRMGMNAGRIHPNHGKPGI